MKNFLEAVQPDRNDWNVEARGNHTYAGLKAVDLAVIGSLSLRVNENRISLADEFPDVTQGLSGPRLALRQRERVEEESRQVVIEAVRRPLHPRVLRGMEMGLEELLRHGGGDTIPPPRRQCIEDRR